ncbi:MAG TPA: septum formation initiator family protein [Bacteroidia bacterium]|nr:septum formation initiator family protein [Bacteroidia bacterium]
MKTLSRFGKIARNKYILVLVALAVWLLFFDKNDLFSQFARRNEVKKLEGDVQYYRNEIARNQKEMAELQSNPKLLEKFAREHYLMKRDNEDIFILVLDSAATPEFSENE